MCWASCGLASHGLASQQMESDIHSNMVSDETTNYCIIQTAYTPAVQFLLRCGISWRHLLVLGAIAFTCWIAVAVLYQMACPPATFTIVLEIFTRLLSKDKGLHTRATSYRFVACNSNEYGQMFRKPSVN